MQMLDSKGIMEKLYMLPGLFKAYMDRRDYAGAKHCYDTAVTVAVFMDLDEKSMTELFGGRGERGQITRQGLFPEESVQAAYWKCIQRNETREKRQYPGIPKAGRQ